MTKLCLIPRSVLLAVGCVTMMVIASGSRTENECVKNGANLSHRIATLKDNSTLCFNDSSMYTLEDLGFIANLTNVTIKGITSEPAIINCADGVGLVFYNISNLTIENVIIQYCGSVVDDDHPITSVIPSTTYHFYNVTVGVLVVLSCDVTFQMVTITRTSGIGLVCVNAVGYATLTDMTFSNNGPHSIKECELCLFPYKSNVNCIYDPDSISGALLLLYIDSHNSSDAYVNVTRATFTDNFSCSLAALSNAHPDYHVNDSTLSTTGGMEIMMAQSNYSVNVEITSSVFNNNTGYVGSGISIEIFESARVCEVVINNCNFTKNGHQKLITGIPNYGGALSVIPYLPSKTHSTHANHSLIISDSFFKENFATIGGVIFIPNTHGRFSEIASLLTTITECTFLENSGVLGHVIYANGMDFSLNLHSMFIEKSKFCANVVEDLYDSLSTPQSFGVIYFSQINSVLSNSEFRYNVGTAINLVYSTLSLQDEVIFQKNMAISGGSIYLQYYSNLVFKNNSRVIFVNNSASIVGGAIYYEYKFNPAGNIFTNCFLYFNSLDPYCVLQNSCYSKDMNITISFVDNTAKYGSAIYGSGLYCPWLLQQTGQNYSTINVPEVLSQNFSNVLQFTPDVTQDFVIATSSKTIQSNISEVKIMPGQIATVYLNATDHYGRPAVDTVAANIFSRQFKTAKNFSSTVLQSGYQLLQRTSLTATDIQINGVENKNTTVVIYSLTSSAQKRIPVYVSRCVFGFTYDSTHRACVCQQYLEDNHVQCDYYTGHLIKPEYTWIGVLDNHTVVLSCVYDYCSDNTSFCSEDFDEQCIDKRGGILCGGCKPDYGAKTGHTGCAKCDGVTNALIFVLCLILTGIWIFFVTSFLHIYVSDGHSYPIYFYVNIIFLFRGAIFNTFYERLRPKDYFYAILNIRGIYNFCVHSNIGPLGMAGLNFSFPLYLLLIVIFITLFTRLRGPYYGSRYRHSTTKVFATVLYICYSLLLDYSFSILNFVTIKTPSGTQVRWRIDPNVLYFRGWHGVLAGVSVFILLMLFTVAIVLLFPRQAYRFKKVQRLKPLIDAFQAPFKFKYSFWIGLQLVLRVCLHIIAFTVPDDYQLYVAGTILCTLLYVQTLCSPYKDNIINALDNLLLVMLIVQFIESLATTKIPVLVTACEIVYFTLYLLFVAVHVVRRFPIIKRYAFIAWYRLRSLCGHSIRDQYTEIDSFAEDKSESVTPVEPFITSVRTDYASVPSTTIPHFPSEVVNYSELREPILELDDGY